MNYYIWPNDNANPKFQYLTGSDLQTHVEVAVEKSIG